MNLDVSVVLKPESNSLWRTSSILPGKFAVAGASKPNELPMTRPIPAEVPIQTLPGFRLF
jgi:hypothetical protein